MKQFFRKPVAAAVVAMIVIAAVLFLIPINLFDGEIVYHDNFGTYSRFTKISLSYFIGIGASPEQLKDVVSFRLVGMGYFFAALLLLALPALIGYRVWIANQPENRKS